MCTRVVASFVSEEKQLLLKATQGLKYKAMQEL